MNFVLNIPLPDPTDRQVWAELRVAPAFEPLTTTPAPDWMEGAAGDLMPAEDTVHVTVELKEEPAQKPRTIAPLGVADIAAEPNLERRAVQLFFANLDLSSPKVMGLYASVNVPEAGEWGRKAQTRLVKSETKPKRAKASRKQKPVPLAVTGMGEGNLWIDFPPEDNEATPAPEPGVTDTSA
jgi:hypothetical protein